MKTRHNAFLHVLGIAALLSGGVLPGAGGQPSAAGQQPAAGQPAAPARGPAPRVNPTSAPKGADVAGFIQRWIILEPIRVAPQLTDSAVQAVVKKEYFPDQFTVIPHDGDAVTVGDESLTWHAVDTHAYNVNLFHFATALHKPTSNVLFWAVTVVDAPRDMPGVRLAIGSNAASVWWLNGQEVIGIYNDRQTVIDDGVSKRVTLKKGPNVIRAAIVNAGGATDFCARFLDGDDSPVKGVVVKLDASGNAAPPSALHSRLGTLQR
jgi:hypothetical protein